MKEFNFEKIFEAMKKNDISELIVKDGGKLYEIRRGGFKQTVQAGVVAQTLPQATPVIQTPVQTGGVTSQASGGSVSQTQSTETSSGKNYHEVKSPLVGTFYSCPKPGMPPFVEVGMKVTKGQKLCIVEAMKNFNEIESDVDGVVKEICKRDGELVQFNDVLVRIEKT